MQQANRRLQAIVSITLILFFLGYLGIVSQFNLSIAPQDSATKVDSKSGLMATDPLERHAHRPEEISMVGKAEDTQNILLETSLNLKYPVLTETSDGSEIVYAAKHLLVRFEKALDAGISGELKRQGFVAGKMLQGNTYLISWETDRPEMEFQGKMAKLLNLEAVAHVEKDAVLYAQETTSPNATNWTYDIDLNYINTHNLRADGVVIAVLDSGINSSHEDLQGVILINPAETVNGSDSDGNGFRDDTVGYDFVDLDNDPTDEDGHGTAIAGAIAAIRGNGKGIDGIAQGVKLLNVRILNEDGLGFISDAIKGVNYAASFNSDIMNCSWNSAYFSEELLAAFQGYNENGGIVITASGNDGLNLSSGFSRYPACFDLDHIISVGSYGQDGEVSDFSNYAYNNVDWMLPGENIYLPGMNSHSYSSSSGTSFSTAIMSGIMALAKNRFPESDWDSIIDNCKKSTPPHLPFYGGVYPINHKVQYYGILELSRLFNEDYVVLPEIQVSVSPDSYLYGDNVTFTASGIDELIGDAMWFDRWDWNYIEEHSNSVTLKAMPSNEDWEIYFYFGSYYAETLIGPLLLNPQTKDLYITNEFQSEYQVDQDSPLEIVAAVGGSDPISITWYAENGYEVSGGPVLQVSSTILGYNKAYYFVAENSVSQITSPLIEIEDTGGLGMQPIQFEGRKFEDNPQWPFEGRPLKEVVFGNGIYFGVSKSEIMIPSDNYISKDGVSWICISTMLNHVVENIEFFKGYFYGTIAGVLGRSTNGMDWEPVEDGPFSETRVVNEYIVCMKSDGQHWKSLDGETWIPSDPIWFAGGYYYRVMDETNLEYSTDLNSWENVFEEKFGSITGQIDDIRYAHNLWLLKQGDWVYQSQDGVNWFHDPSVQFSGTQIDNLFYENGSYYCGTPYLSHVISDSLEWKRRVGDITDGIQKRLSNGQLFATGWLNGKALIFVQNQNLVDSQPNLSWPENFNKDLLLGDPIPVHFPISESSIDYIDLYCENSLIERRVTYPFFGDYYLNSVGDFSVMAIINLKDGTSHFTEILPVSIDIPELKYSFSGINTKGYPTIIGNGNDLGVLYQTASDQKRFLHWIPDINDLETEIQIGDTPPFRSDRAHGLFRSNSGNEVSIIFKEPAGVRHLYKIVNKGTVTHLTTFTELDDETIETYWDPDVITYSSFRPEESPAKTIEENGNRISVISIPQGKQPYKDLNGQWQLTDYNQDDQRHGNNLLSVNHHSIVKNVTTGHEWALPYAPEEQYSDYDLRGFFGDWIWVHLHWYDGRYSETGNHYLLHYDGTLTPFNLRESVHQINYEDNLGYYFAGWDHQTDSLVLMPRNEIVAEPDWNSTGINIASTGNDLTLTIPFTLRQLSVGPGKQIPISFNVYLSNDSVPNTDDALHLGEVTMKHSLDRGGKIPLSVTVPLPENIWPGTYSVGVTVNLHEKDFPDRTINNEVWYEWTPDYKAVIDIRDNPEEGLIQVSPNGGQYRVGDEVSLTFAPNPGYTFTGWGPRLGGVENPSVLALPFKLSVRAGVLPSDLATLLPDAEFTGNGTWHTSNSFGEFESWGFPWIRHIDHGWLNINMSSDGKSAFFHDSELGWIYMQSEALPYLYQIDTGSWLQHVPGTNYPRWFYDASLREWIGISTDD